MWGFITENLLYFAFTTTYILMSFKWFRLIDISWWWVCSPILLYVGMLGALIIFLWWRIVS